MATLGCPRSRLVSQDAFSLYLGLAHCPNGELYDQIRLKGRLGEEAACFYAAEVVLMLEHLREHAVVSHVWAFGGGSCACSGESRASGCEPCACLAHH